MKRRYLTFNIRSLKAKLSQLSRTCFRITRKFFKSKLGIDKRDWSRLTKKEIIRVLNYVYNCMISPVDLVKKTLTHFDFRPVSADQFFSLLPKTKPGQHWKMIDRAEVGELDSSGIPLYFFHYQIVYPRGYQMNLWDNPDCFLIVAELDSQSLYGYGSQVNFNLCDFLGRVERYYQRVVKNSVKPED